MSLAQKEADIYLGGSVRSRDPLKVGKASSAQAGLGALLLADIWGLTQPALPRLFCPRCHLRRQEGKGSFVGRRRGSGHFSAHFPTFPVPTLCTHMGQTLCRPWVYLYR